MDTDEEEKSNQHIDLMTMDEIIGLTRERSATEKRRIR